jgi:hypothetical protein
MWLGTGQLRGWDSHGHTGGSTRANIGRRVRETDQKVFTAHHWRGEGEHSEGDEGEECGGKASGGGYARGCEC